MSKDPKSKDRYHHGNLPGTLVKEGAQLLAEVGTDGFSLRKLAQRAGVTVAAPSHHFGSVRGVLTAIATEGFVRLARRMDAAAASADTGEEAVLAMCTAYYQMGTTDAGYAAVMFRLDLLDAADERFRSRAFHAFAVFQQALAQAVPTRTDDARVAVAARALWATTHGLTNLTVIDDLDAGQTLRSAVVAHLNQLRRA